MAVSRTGPTLGDMTRSRTRMIAMWLVLGVVTSVLIYNKGDASFVLVNDPVG